MLELSSKIKNPERQISVIINSFNFNKVRVAMDAMNWSWHDDKSRGRYIPTVEDLKRSATRSLRHAIQEYDGVPFQTGSGGLFVEVNQFGELGLSFRIDDGWYIPAENGDIDYFGMR